MSFDAQKLYSLLPAIYRIRDETVQHGELKALLSAVAEQAQLIEEDLQQLYDDQFIETCAEWGAPYIGDLIGYRTLHGKAASTRSRRAEVANTIAYRRRKGTATMLEQLARDVTEWPARVVEFFQLLATAQYMNHLRPQNAFAPDLRQVEALEHIDGAFDSAAHTVDVRRIATAQGRHNIPNIGIFLWRLGAQSLTHSPASRVDANRFLFSPLGHNAPLFTRPEGEEEITHLAELINVPAPISRRLLDRAFEQYYGTNKSILLAWAPANPADPPDLIPASQVHACDLSDVKDAGGNVIGWNHVPLVQPGVDVAIDPVLGRIALKNADPRVLLASFHHGFSADMGGGEYERAATFLVEAPLHTVGMPELIQPALDAAQPGGVVEISDSGRYEQATAIEVQAGALEFRAANGHRPTLVLNGEFLIQGGSEGIVTLNGLLIGGAGLRVPASAANKLKLLRLRHCTLVPGLTLDINGEPTNSVSPSLIVEPAGVSVKIEHSILGAMQVAGGSKAQIRDSILDATDSTAVAFSAPGGSATTAGGILHIERSTVIGKVHTVLMELASNTIFLADLATGDSWTAPVRADRKQAGCVRFSYVPPDSQVPRRFRCQPAGEGDPLTVRPRFTSLRYGQPGYGQLSSRCAEEIRRGADDEAEMGAFHDLFQPQRESDLKTRLDEYLRFGMEAGIFYVT